MMIDMDITAIKNYLMETLVDVVEAENNSLTEEGLKYFAGSVQERISGFFEIARIGHWYFYNFENEHDELDQFMVDVNNAVETPNYKKFIEKSKQIVEKYGENSK